jgi:hypothetical protein
MSPSSTAATWHSLVHQAWFIWLGSKLSSHDRALRIVASDYLNSPSSRIRASCFGLRRPKGTGSDDSLLQKIRNQVKLAP